MLASILNIHKQTLFIELHHLQITIMSTFTANYRDVKSLHQGFKMGLWKGALLFLLTFIWLSALADPNPTTNLSKLEAAATMAAFDACERNIITNSDFQFNNSNWNNSPNSLTGVASGYTSDGNFHAWVLPLTGTGTFYQDVSPNFFNQEFSLVVNAGVEDPSGKHTLGLQYINSAGDVLATESVEVDNNLNTSGTLQAYTLSGFAPAGTTTVRIFGSSDTGYLRMDNFCLTQIEDPFAAPATCSFDLGFDEEYCGESIPFSGPPSDACSDSSINTYLWTKDGKPYSTFQDILAGGIGTYCLTFTDCDGCSTTDCVELTECFTGAPSANVQTNLSSLGLQTFFDCGENRIIEPVAYGYLENPGPMSIPNPGNVLGCLLYTSPSPRDRG